MPLTVREERATNWKWKPKRKFRKRKLLILGYFFIYTNCLSHRATGAGQLQVLPLLTLPDVAEPWTSQIRGQKSQEVRSIQAKVLPEGFRHDRLKLCMKSHGEMEPDRRVLSQCFISSIKPTCVRRVGTIPTCNVNNINKKKNNNILQLEAGSPCTSCFAAWGRASRLREVAGCLRGGAPFTLHAGKAPGGHRPTNGYQWAGKHGG